MITWSTHNEKFEKCLLWDEVDVRSAPIPNFCENVNFVEHLIAAKGKSYSPTISKIDSPTKKSFIRMSKLESSECRGDERMQQEQAHRPAQHFSS